MAIAGGCAAGDLGSHLVREPGRCAFCYGVRGARRVERNPRIARTHDALNSARFAQKLAATGYRLIEDISVREDRLLNGPSQAVLQPDIWGRTLFACLVAAPFATAFAAFGALSAIHGLLERMMPSISAIRARAPRRPGVDSSHATDSPGRFGIRVLRERRELQSRTGALGAVSFRAGGRAHRRKSRLGVERTRRTQCLGGRRARLQRRPRHLLSRRRRPGHRPASLDSRRQIGTLHARRRSRNSAIRTRTRPPSPLRRSIHLERHARRAAQTPGARALERRLAKGRSRGVPAREFHLHRAAQRRRGHAALSRTQRRHFIAAGMVARRIEDRIRQRPRRP